MAIRRKAFSGARPPSQYAPHTAAKDARELARARTLDLIPLDVEGLAGSLGIAIRYEAMPIGQSGYFSVVNGTPVIGVNHKHPRNRQRFTIAHELGHYFLHRHYGTFTDQYLYRDDGKDERELDANRFASDLLMPADRFAQLYEQNGYDLRSVAEAFGVSEEAAEYRLPFINNRVYQ